jgi:hypothetical protein
MSRPAAGTPECHGAPEVGWPVAADGVRRVRSVEQPERVAPALVVPASESPFG